MSDTPAKPVVTPIATPDQYAPGNDQAEPFPATANQPVSGLPAALTAPTQVPGPGDEAQKIQAADIAFALQVEQAGRGVTHISVPSSPSIGPGEKVVK